MAYLCAILKNVVYGTSVFFTGSLTASTDVWDVLALRFLLSFVVMWGLKMLHVLRIDVNVSDLFRRGKAPQGCVNLILTALFEPVLYMMFETFGIAGTSGVTAGVILSLSPIPSIIFSSVMLGEKTTLMQKLFLFLGIAGVIYIAVNTNTSDGNNSAMGIVFLLLAIVCGALFLVFSRKSSGNFHAMEITYISCFAGMMIFNMVNVVRHLCMGDIAMYFAPYFNMDNMIGFVFLGVLSTIVATGMNNFAMRSLSVAVMSAFGGLSTFVTVLVGVIFGKEPLYLYHYIGFALILCRMVGVNYIAIRNERRARETEANHHDGNGAVATVD